MTLRLPRYRSFLLVLSAVPMFSALTRPVGAQEVELGEPTAAYPEPFGLLGGVRELSDGRVLVADPLGGALIRLDAALTQAEKLGAEGEGPGEYQQPDGLWPIGGDASLLVDLGNARLTVVGPDGALGKSSPLVLSGGTGPGGMALAIPGGTDDAGYVYFAGSPLSPDGMRDSVEVFRLDRSSGEFEPVVTIRAPEITEQRSGADFGIRRVPLGRADAWGVAPNGGLYITRERDYSVEFISPAGARMKGPPVEVRPVPIGRAEKEEWADDNARNGGVMIDIGMQGGQRRVSMSRSTGRRSEVDGQPWNDTKPPFVVGRIRVDAAGHGWVRRSEPAGRPALYDVFDQKGRLVRTVRFPAGRTLVAFGDGSLYAASTDAFDQQFLERYSMPQGS